METTEAHKIPQTILSRCQRFDFRSISTRQITDSLKMICEKEKVTADEEALWIIARQGDGSMRDSLSLLDQVITFANGPLTRENVIETLGLTDRSLLLATLTSLAQRDAQATLSVIEKIQLAGYEPSLFARDLLENIRNLLLIKVSQINGQAGPTQLLQLPDSELRFLESLAVDLTEEDIHLLFDMALKSAGDIPRSSEPRIVLEMALLRMSQAPRIASLAQLLNGAATTTTATAPSLTKKSPATKPMENHASTHKVDPVGLNPQDKWLEFVNKIKTTEALFAAKIESLLFLGEKNKVLELAIPQKFSFLKDQLGETSVRNKLQGFIQTHFGPGYSHQIMLGKDETAGTSAQAMTVQKQKAKEDELAKKVADHPLIKSATTALKGQIKSIKSQQQ
jgi:DNA polymerase-3 subunit gamma/tau